MTVPYSNRRIRPLAFQSCLPPYCLASNVTKKRIQENFEPSALPAPTNLDTRTFCEYSELYTPPFLFKLASTVALTRLVSIWYGCIYAVFVKIGGLWQLYRPSFFSFLFFIFLACLTPAPPLLRTTSWAFSVLRRPPAPLSP